MRCSSNCSRTASRGRWCSITMTLSSPARWANSTSRIPSRAIEGFGLFLLRLLRPVIGNAPDYGGVAELLAQIIDCAFGVCGAAIEHVGVVGRRAGLERADAGAHQAERGAVDFFHQHLAGNRENLRGQLRRRRHGLRAGALPEIGGL